MEMTTLKSNLWHQFGAAFDMFNDALDLCPDELWTAAMWKDSENAAYGQVWYIAYHTLSWADLFLGGSYKEFQPPAPFIRGKLPEKPYTKEEIYGYFNLVRQKCQTTLESLTDEKANQICMFEWMEPSYFELQMYSMRHVQEHGAQLNLFLGQQGIEGQDWVAVARDKTA